MQPASIPKAMPYLNKKGRSRANIYVFRPHLALPVMGVSFWGWEQAFARQILCFLAWAVGGDSGWGLSWTPHVALGWPCTLPLPPPPLLRLPPFHSQPASPKTGLHLLPHTHMPPAHCNLAATPHSPELLPPRAPMSSSFSSTTWWPVKLLVKFSLVLSDPHPSHPQLRLLFLPLSLPLPIPFPSASFALTCLCPPAPSL